MMKFNFAILLAVLFLASCQQDSPLNPVVDPVDNTVTVDTNPPAVAGLMAASTSGCYEIDFPISFVYDDGTVVTANTEDELISILSTEPLPVNLSFPVNLIDPATGATATANDEDELMTFFADCDGSGTGNPGNPTWGDSSTVNFGFIACYDLEYPVTFTLLDGTTATANSVDDLSNIFSNMNPPVDFVYPLNLIGLADGESYSAASVDELGTLIAACDPFTGGGGNPGLCDSSIVDFGYLACYELVFPVSFVLTDGTTATAQTEDDLVTIFDPNNPPADFAYPINLVGLVDGESYSAADATELEALILDCGNFTGGNGGGGNWGSNAVIPMTLISISQDPNGTNPSCYTFNYPASVTLIDGSTATATDDTEMLDIVFGSPVEDFVYPISVTEVSSGNTLTANNEDEVATLIDECI